MYIPLPTKSILVLSSEESVRDLLDRRSVIYSDRPSDLVRFSELCVSVIWSCPPIFDEGVPLSGWDGGIRPLPFHSKQVYEVRKPHSR